MSFTQLGLPESISRAAQEAGYTEATSIQSQAIPVLMNGQDLVGCSQTGTGKTAAFAMPLLAKIDLDNKRPQLLVMAPTRELAIQVAEAFETYGSQMKKLRVLAVFGGAAYQPQLSALQRGVHVVVGTPGRLIDHVKSNALDLSGIHSLVLDEADEMLRMGFIDDVKWILSQIPETRQIALFSATMPGPIREIADKYLRNPHSITVERSQKVASTIRQQHIVVGPKDKVELLARLLEIESTDGVIVFVKTKLGTVELSERLTARGFNAAALNGDIAQSQRTRTVEKLKSGEIDILVATDVAARGLDVDRISHVINYDMPHDEEAYVHRIGRTGRAGRDGAAILLVTPAQRRLVRVLQNATGQEIPLVQGPSVDALNQKRTERLKEKITLALESRQLPTFQGIVEQYCNETGRSPLEVAAAIAAMHQGKRAFFAKSLETNSQPSWNDRSSREDRPGRFNRSDRFEHSDRSERPRKSSKSRSEGNFEPRPMAYEPTSGAAHEGREPFVPRESRQSDEGANPAGRSGVDKRAARPAREPFEARSDRGRGDKAPAARGMTGRDVVPMQMYRVEVGRAHGVMPGNLVGAIANESGLTGPEIGRIDIYDQYSIVRLPDGMPKEVYNALRKTWVGGRQLRISLAEQKSSRFVEQVSKFRKKVFDRKSPAGKPAGRRARPAKS